MKNEETLRDLIQALGDEGGSAELQALWPEEERQFAPGFEDRVMAALPGMEEEAAGKGDVISFLPTAFKWVAAAGVAAAITLLVLTWQETESLSWETLSGNAELRADDLITLNMY